MKGIIYTMVENSKKFVDREFEEVEGGYYEEKFYYTPNGSFWDEEGYYFNREGYDKHGGYYDNNWKYVPGKSWDKKNQCYPSDIENNYDYDDEFMEDNGDLDDGFGDCYDYGNDQDDYGYDDYNKKGQKNKEMKDFGEIREPGKTQTKKEEVKVEKKIPEPSRKEEDKDKGSKKSKLSNLFDNK
mmetsp:Transcript_14567/g.15098  ORF Transcript_14567/g.15098 Transcript_14567/m.15098 type:complete len:184 (+) Transcript_14567:1-552(+)